MSPGGSRLRWDSSSLQRCGQEQTQAPISPGLARRAPPAGTCRPPRAGVGPATGSLSRRAPAPPGLVPAAEPPRRRPAPAARPAPQGAAARTWPARAGNQRPPAALGPRRPWAPPRSAGPGEAGTHVAGTGRSQRFLPGRRARGEGGDGGEQRAAESHVEFAGRLPADKAGEKRAGVRPRPPPPGARGRPLRPRDGRGRSGRTRATHLMKVPGPLLAPGARRSAQPRGRLRRRGRGGGVAKPRQK